MEKYHRITHNRPDLREMLHRWGTKVSSEKKANVKSDFLHEEIKVETAVVQIAIAETK